VRRQALNIAASGFCPQCGAAVSLEMGDPLLRCDYCRTSLYMVPRDGTFRYLLNIPDVSEDTSGLVWLPYWRFRGLRYSVGPGDSIGAHLVDTTVGASRMIPDASSLGISPQAAGTRLATGHADMPSPDMDMRSALMAADTRLRTLEDTPALLYRFVGESRSLIYAPFRVIAKPGNTKQAMLRAVWGNRENFEIRMDRLNEAAGNSAGRNYSIKFLPLICPECASPLPEKTNALTLHCPNCSTLWGIHAGTFARMEHSFLPLPDTAGAADKISFLPFWNLSLKLKNFPLENRADIRRMLVSWKPVLPQWEQESVPLLVPAFKLNPGLFLRIAASLSIADLELQGAKSPLTGRHVCYPVRLPMEEAAQAVKVILARMFVRHKKLLPHVPGIKLKIKRIRLLFLPFKITDRDLIQCHTGLSINSRAMKLGEKV